MTIQAAREREAPAYDVESYWSRVAGQIAARGRGNVVAGDDDPFWRYKRQRFLENFLHSIDFNDAVVLEVGCGPGGNLLEIAGRHAPAKLMAVDISQPMIDIATSNLASHHVAAELHKVDGAHLPFADRSVDLTFTVTVLQHNTEAASFSALCGELCRVTRDRIVLMEDTGSGVPSASGSFVARSVDTYSKVLGDHGFALSESSRLNIRVSRFAHAVVHKLFVSKNRQEGDPIGRAPQIMLTGILAFTQAVDNVVAESEGLTKMVFRRVPGGGF